MPGKTADLTALAEAVRVAQENHESAKTRESVARGETCAALNALNGAQKDFDRAVVAMKAGAPYDSDWKSAERFARSVPVSA